MPILMEFNQKTDTAVSLDIFNGFGIYVSYLFWQLINIYQDEYFLNIYNNKNPKDICDQCRS